MLYQRGIAWQSGEREPTPEEINEQIDWYLSPTAFDGAWRWRHGDKVPTLTSNDIMNRADGFIALS